MRLLYRDITGPLLIGDGIAVKLWVAPSPTAEIAVGAVVAVHPAAMRGSDVAGLGDRGLAAGLLVGGCSARRQRAEAQSAGAAGDDGSGIDAVDRRGRRDPGGRRR